MGQGKVELPLDESGDEGEEEVYDPDYEEEDEPQKHESSQVLNRSKPGVALNPVNEEVKEMKSVDEATNKDDSDASEAKLNLLDINDVTTPKNDDDSYEQNEQSFRG